MGLISKQKSYYGLYLLTFALQVPVVMALFHWIPERRVAALFAGTLFVLIPAAILGIELGIRGVGLRNWTVLGAAQFLLLSALPIFLLRVCNWDQSFENLSLLGLTGPQMHKLSNVTFMLMALMVLLDVIQQWRSRKD
jgi:hypothetical protein